MRERLPKAVYKSLKEIPERLLIINPLLSITRTIKFNKSYTEKISSKGITFEDIILSIKNPISKTNINTKILVT